MDLVFKGVITHVTEPISGTARSGNTWRKQEIAIAEAGQYPNSIVISVLKDEYIGKFSKGDAVTAHLNFRVNEYNGKLFNSISAWKIYKDVEPAQAPDFQPQGVIAQHQAQNNPPIEPMAENDGLPF